MRASSPVRYRVLLRKSRQALPPAVPFTDQVTLVSELPLTVAVYCDCVPSVTWDGPVTATVTVPEPSSHAAGLSTVSPHAVSRSSRRLHAHARRKPVNTTSMQSL